MTKRYSQVFKARAVRMVLDQCGDSPCWRKGISAVAKRVGCGPSTLWAWVLQAERSRIFRPEAGTTGKERKHWRDLRGLLDLRPRVVLAESASRSREAGRPGEQTENP